MSYVIYGLEDPRDALYHYVGITDDVYERFHAHIRGSSGNIQKNGWIFECRQANVMIVMREIERVENSCEEALQREKYWIGYYIDLGHPLKNMQVARTILKDRARMERLARISTKRKEAEVKKVAKANKSPTVEKVARVRNVVEEELNRLRPKALEAWEIGYRSRLAMAQYLGIRENRARQLCNELMKERAVVISEEEMWSKAKAAWDAGCRSRYSIMKHAGILENRARRFLKEFTCESLAQMEEPPGHQIISELNRGTQVPEYLGA